MQDFGIALELFPEEAVAELTVNHMMECSSCPYDHVTVSIKILIKDFSTR